MSGARRASACLVLLVLALGGCSSETPPLPSPTTTGAPPSAAPTATPRPSPTALASPKPTTTATPSASAVTPSAAASGPCAIPFRRIRDAVAAVDAYAYEASGFVYQDVFAPDPFASPSTERRDTAFEGGYQAPDRSRLHYDEGPLGTGEEETISIATDLYVRTVGGWERLPGAADPRAANVLVGLLADAGTAWNGEGSAGDCRLTARQPLPGGAGYRETIVELDAAGLLPLRLQLTVRDALDPSGNRHDAELDYRFDYDAAVAIEPPI